MKAQIKPRINNDGRTKLEDVIPLSTPFIIFIDPSSLCNSRCKFCPSGYPDLIKETGRWQGKIDFELFKKIINDLREFDDKIKVLRLYKEGEPLLNDDLHRMIKYAKDSNCVEYIDTTTNGLLITEEKMKPIIDAGLDKINISVNGMSDKQFLEFSCVNISFNKYVDNIKKLYEIKKNCEIVIKTTGDFLSEDDRKKFYDIFGDYCDRIFIENAAPCWNNFDVEKKSGIKISKEKGIYNQVISNPVDICPYIFYQMCVNSDGSLSLCFLDWEHKLIIGDVKKNSLKEIWNSNLLYSYQVYNLIEKRKYLIRTACENCGQLKYGLPDNIDLYKDKILNNILDKQN